MSSHATPPAPIDAPLLRRGKVRDIYAVGDDRLVLVASDRISAFDWILPTPIPDKGRMLTGITAFWLGMLSVPHHLLTIDVRAMGHPFRDHPELFAGRAMLVWKTEVIPVECVVRGYLAGSSWVDYQKTGAVCGIPLPAGLVQSQKLDEPLFTPATKADVGHDENIPFSEVERVAGPELAARLRDQSIALYRQAAEHALGRGIIIADTKFEWGLRPDGTLLLIDEVLTPDSSRFWPASSYRPGSSPPSFDKQYVRDWLLQSGWDRNSEPPALPDDVVAHTRDKYREAYNQLTGQAFPGVP